jgi:hypothetical protein
MEGSSQKKCLRFFFQGSEQKLIVYTGIPTSEITSTLKILLGIKDDQKVLFLDEEGIPLVLSSFLPTETKIFVSIGDLVTQAIQNVLPNREASGTQVVETSEPKEWIWVKEVSKATFVNDQTFLTFGLDRTIVYGEALKKNGTHYWRIKISHLMCCHDFGICNGKLEATFDTSYHTESDKVVGLPGNLPGESSGPASTGCGSLNIKNNIFGIFVDMDKKICLIVNETNNRMYKYEKFKFEDVVPFYVARKHDVEVSLVDTNQKAPEWVVKLI